jgi:hypothetical protein
LHGPLVALAAEVLVFMQNSSALIGAWFGKKKPKLIW